MLLLRKPKHQVFLLTLLIGLIMVFIITSVFQSTSKCLRLYQQNNCILEAQ